jgi:outer membrane protein assembly factor BamE (lipoprotein component of BamABCDE complex)
MRTLLFGFICTLCSQCIGPQQPPIEESSVITRDQVEKLRIGMTPDEVREILQVPTYRERGNSWVYVSEQENYKYYLSFFTVVGHGTKLTVVEHIGHSPDFDRTIILDAEDPFQLFEVTKNIYIELEDSYIEQGGAAN